ncbi:unnamed protein product [Rhodiola kirilowii]
MVDSKTVTSQVHDLQLIMHEMNSEGMKVNEPFQVAAVIEKLPLGWKEAQAKGNVYGIPGDSP